MALDNRHRPVERWSRRCHRQPKQTCSVRRPRHMQVPSAGRKPHYMSWQVRQNAGPCRMPPALVARRACVLQRTRSDASSDLYSSDKTLRRVKTRPLELNERVYARETAYKAGHLLRDAARTCRRFLTVLQGINDLSHAIHTTNILTGARIHSRLSKRPCLKPSQQSHPLITLVYYKVTVATSLLS